MAALAETRGLGRYRPTTVELARGLMLGEYPSAPQLPEAGRDSDPLTAFEAPVRRALERPPCCVAFSGGRDSSALLAVAAALARRESLPAPVPLTFRFPDRPYADESRWQEQVVAAVGVREWERIVVTPGELDWLGPVASSVLRRDGLLYPATMFFYEPLLQRAAGGTLLTGHGGDELLHDWRWARAGGTQPALTRAAARAGMALYTAAPERSRALAYRIAASPAGLRRARRELSWPWLRAPAARAARAALVAEKAAEPASWAGRTKWRVGRRALNATTHSLAVLAERAGAAAVHPFLDPAFVVALAAAGGTRGLGSRTDLTRHLFGGRLPDNVLARSTKAGFGSVFWGEGSRAFAGSWNGDGLPLDLVDPDALRRCWAEHRPPYSAALLLQAAWLAREPSSLT